jgi:multicomponent Na+:H+ antiporter subunit B
MRMREKAILRLVAKGFVPFILLFALYTQFHGDFGPGGGFQAGVIFAAGLILYGLIWGLEALQRLAPPLIVEIAAAIGVLLYGLTGVATMLLGGKFLEYAAFSPEHPAHGQHIGLLLIEAGVGITVAAAMLVIYYKFAARALPESP